MKRRDFVLSAAAMGTVLLKSRAYGQTGIAQPVRTARLTDSSKLGGNVSSQDYLFDGKQLVCLYRSVPGAGLNADSRLASGPSPFAITATDTTGNVLWSYPLPKGIYISLGTHQGSIVIFALRYEPASGNAVQRPLLLLDPSNENLNVIGTYDGMAGPLKYAGGSTFFRISHGAGEIWTLDAALTQKIAGITAPAIATKFPEMSLMAPGTMAVVDSAGVSLATVSLESGAVASSAISSEAVSSYRATIEAVQARAGVDSSNPRMATPTFITAIGGDAGGAIYATVPLGKPYDVVQIVSLDANGSGITLGRVRVPLNSKGRPIVASRVVAANSQIGILSYGGDIAWYVLPLG